jgi:hypothetical protein
MVYLTTYQLYRPVHGVFDHIYILCMGLYMVDDKAFPRWFVFRIIEFMDFFHRPIKTKAKRLQLLRFDCGFCFRHQVNNKNKGGG